MVEEEHILTRSGYEKLKTQLGKLLVVLEGQDQRLAELNEDRKVDDEDPEFFNVMSDKQLLEERIERLRTVLAIATVIDDDPDPETASPGDRVVVMDLDEKEELTFDLLSSLEIIYGRKGVSLGSPVGQALLGKRLGEKVEVKVPDGVARYKLVRFEEIPPDEDED